ncbi:MAG TPA: nucleoside-diphosphate kinase [Thermomicrobiaceae bacterium]|nr:nucleoside-diphosphate kinase [Thermomicrobiaceae bacterium]
MERTLIIVKPDGVQRGLAGEIVSRFERRGLKLVGLKLQRVSRELAERHYGVHRGKPFYQGLVDYITSGPVVVGVLEGPDAVAAVRNTVGATDPAKAAAGTIRGDLGVAIGRNLVHASDGAETAAHEIGLFFQPDELVSYSRALDPWILEE